jgi:histidinol dehydrogenase
MKKIKYPEKQDWPELLKRPEQPIVEIEQTALEIFSEVSSKGDRALIKYTDLFDGVKLGSLQVSSSAIEAATSQIDPALAAAILLAKENITKFHRAQRSAKIEVETMNGVVCWQEKRPIQKVGLYIPGGSAPLFSTILMLAIPAKLAGCEEIVLCTPPDSEGNIDPAILFTAQLCGIDKVFRVGGIQAIAAMTYGTETVPPVYKIFGPGNQFVTTAKQLATKFGVAIDMPAGPSELLVFADESAKPAFVASDLLSQAEHGPDSQVILVSTSEDLLNMVSAEIESQLAALPRKEIAAKAIENSRLILVEDPKTALQLINSYGPEHFIVCCKDENYFTENIQNAGSVFVGPYSPESAGDYASGTNHTLPTHGYAKQYSGITLDSFMKSISFQQISKEGLKSLGPAVELMAEAEGLQAHKNAVSIRLKEIAKDE